MEEVLFVEIFWFIFGLVCISLGLVSIFAIGNAGALERRRREGKEGLDRDYWTENPWKRGGETDAAANDDLRRVRQSGGGDDHVPPSGSAEL